MAGRKRAYDEVLAASSENARDSASFFDHLAPEIRSRVAAYCGLEMLPMLVAAGVVVFSKLRTGKRCISYDAVLVDALESNSGEWLECKQPIPKTMLAWLDNYASCVDVVPSVSKRRIMCALLVDIMIDPGVLYRHTYCMLGDRGCSIDDEQTRDTILSTIAPLLDTSNMDRLLSNAASFGDIAAVRILLAAGANVMPDETTMIVQPLIGAVGGGFPDVVALLLASGADPTDYYSTCTISASPIHHFPFGAHFLYKDNKAEEASQMLADLLAHGADINFHNNDGRTALFEAVLTSDIRVVELLLNNGAKPVPDGNQRNWRTPLHAAISVNNIEIAKLMLERGVDITISGDPAKTAERYIAESFMSQEHKDYLLGELAKARARENGT